MPFPEDLFATRDPAMPDDPTTSPWGWVPQEWSAPPAPPAPGELDAGGVPAAAIEAVAPGTATPKDAPKEAAPPPYAIVPHDEPAALPPKAQPDEIDMAGDVHADARTATGLPDAAPEAPEEIDMAGDPGAAVVRNPLDDPDTSPEEAAAALAEVEKTDPGLAAQYRTAWETKRALKSQNEQIEALAKDRDRYEANIRERDESMAEAKAMRRQIEADAQKLADEKIDPRRWWSDRSVPQKIAGVLAAIVGGMVQSRTGGRNEGLAILDQAIEQDIAAQRENLAGRRAEIGRRHGLVGQLFSETQDEFRSAETMRAASWSMVAKDLEIKAQQYDPRGTTALRLLDSAKEAYARRDASIAAAEAAHFNRALKVREDSRQERELAIKERAERAKGAGSSSPVFTPAQLTALYGAGAPVPPIPMSAKDYERWLGTQGKIAGIEKTRGEIADAKVSAVGKAADAEVKAVEARVSKSGPGGSPYAVGDQEGKPLRKKNGDVFEIKDDSDRKRAREVMTAAQNVRRIADLVKIMRADKGGASALVGSPEYQQLQSLASQVDFETFVGYGLGAPSEGDKQLAANVRGGKDIASFVYDPSSGFEAYAKGVEEKASTQLRTLGYDGEDIKLKRAEPAKAVERSHFENVDVFDAPEIEGAKDPAIQKRAAARAADSLPQLAKQSPKEELVIWAAKNEDRYKRGLIDGTQVERGRAALRKAYRARLLDALPKSAGSWYHPDRTSINALDDADIDRMMREEAGE